MHFTTIKAQILYSGKRTKIKDEKLTLNLSQLFKYFWGNFKILVIYSKKI